MAHGSSSLSKYKRLPAPTPNYIFIFIFIFNLIIAVPSAAFLCHRNPSLPLSSGRLSFSSTKVMSGINDDNGISGDDEGDMPISGSFFNEIPEKNDEMESLTPESDTSSRTTVDLSGDDFDMFQQLIQNTKVARSNSGVGFAKTTVTTDHVTRSIIQTTKTNSSGERNSFVGIGKPLNDVSNPEYDENGYTLYADETTGERKRVFEALVEYPSIFKIKIVGKDDEKETFSPDIVELVANSCGVETNAIEYTKRKNGQWTSVTVHAPVEDADMLYALYENIDRDPRVKFKF